MPFSNNTKRQRWEKGQVVPEYNTIMAGAPQYQKQFRHGPTVKQVGVETKKSGMHVCKPTLKTQAPRLATGLGGSSLT
jgi:hypothetical protein